MKPFVDSQYLSLIKAMETRGKIPENLIVEILNIVTVSEIKKGEILVEEGNKCDYLFFLNNGLCRSFYTRDNGDMVTSSFIQPNEFFTNVKGFINGVNSSETIEALDDASICKISRKNYWKIMTDNPILSPINSHIINHHRIELEERIKMLQCLTAKEKYLFFKSNYPKLVNNVQLSFIASFLGVRLETLSRTRKNLLSNT